MATKYLIEIGGIFYGYDSAVLARIDILMTKQAGEQVGIMLQKNGDKFRTVYHRIHEEDLKDENDTRTD